MKELTKKEKKWIDSIQKKLSNQPQSIKLIYVGGNKIKVEKNYIKVETYINTNKGSFDAGIN